jgi:dolichol-phosphate mannosyltransferase
MLYSVNCQAVYGKVVLSPLRDNYLVGPFMKPYVLMALPCFNEAENLPPLLEQFEKLSERYGHMFDLRIVVINDASSDNTLEVLENIKSPLNIDIVTHSQNRGLTGGINSAIAYFEEDRKKDESAIAYGIMDGDNSHSPFFIPGMLERIDHGFDVVIASRYRNGARTCGVSFFRQLLSFGVAFLFKLMRNIQGVLDYSCGYRLYSPRMIKALKTSFKDDVVLEPSFASMVELLVKCNLIGGFCTEVPILLRYDLKLGDSKMRFRKTIAGTLKVLLTLRKVKS